MSDVLAFIIIVPIIFALLIAIINSTWGFYPAPWWWWHQTPPSWWWHGARPEREDQQSKPTVVHNYYIVRGNTPTPQPLPPPPVAEEVFIEGDFREVRQTPLLSDGEKEILRLTGGDQHALVRTSRGR